MADKKNIRKIEIFWIIETSIIKLRNFLSNNKGVSAEADSFKP